LVTHLEIAQVSTRADADRWHEVEAACSYRPVECWREWQLEIGP
jgi:hypothetical protein